MNKISLMAAAVLLSTSSYAADTNVGAGADAGLFGTNAVYIAPTAAFLAVLLVADSGSKTTEDVLDPFVPPPVVPDPGTGTSTSTGTGTGTGTGTTTGTGG